LLSQLRLELGTSKIQKCCHLWQLASWRTRWKQICSKVPRIIVTVTYI
jgi:hypothetical protein